MANSTQVTRGAKPTDPVFLTASGEQVSVAFKRAAKGAKIEDFRFHDLRHTAASWLRMKGADIDTVAQLLGHKDLRMAARYQHLSPSFLDAARTLDDLFNVKAISSGDSPAVVNGAANAERLLQNTANG